MKIQIIHNLTFRPLTVAFFRVQIINTKWRVCRQYGIQTVFRMPTTLGQELCSFKDRIPRERWSGVVYEIPCNCGLTYIGETKRSRSLETRLKEHKARRGKGNIIKREWNRIKAEGYSIGMLYRLPCVPVQHHTQAEPQKMSTDN